MAKRKADRRGGKREGAGRKPGDPSGSKRSKTIWLTPAEQAHCESLGQGSIQDGIRCLIAKSIEERARAGR